MTESEYDSNSESEEYDSESSSEVNILNGKILKKEFEFLYEYITEIYVVDTIPARWDKIIDIDEIIALSNLTNLSELSDNTIRNLYTFKDGVKFLSLFKEELYDRGLLQYMFSSPFLDVLNLLELISNSFVMDHGEDIFLYHLAFNPNIYDES